MAYQLKSSKFNIVKLRVSKDIYMPTNPRSKIIDIVITSGCPM